MIYVVHSQAYIIGEDKKELSLLLKDITIFELSNPKVSITLKKDFQNFRQTLFQYFFFS